MYRRSLCCAGLLSALFWFLGSCDQNSLPPVGPKVVVQLNNTIQTPAIITWKVTATLNGMATKERIMDFDGSVTSFALELPVGAQGQLKVVVKGLAKSSDSAFVSSTGENEMVLADSTKVDLPVDLKRVQVCNSDNWCWERPYPSGRTINKMWGSGPNDLWAVGVGGLILHYDGQAWELFPSGTEYELLAIWGVSPKEIYAAGKAGTIVRWDGAAWKPLALPAGTQGDIGAVWAGESQDVWFVAQVGGPPWGKLAVFHWKANAWGLFSQDMLGLASPGNLVRLAGAIGFAGRPWIFGTQLAAGVNQPLLLRGDSSTWTDLSAQLGPMSAPETGAFCTGISARSPTDIFFTCGTKVLRFDGQNPATDLAAPTLYWNDIKTVGNDQVWIVPDIEPYDPNKISNAPRRWDGSQWLLVSDAGNVPPAGSKTIWVGTDGTNPSDVWVAGLNGMVRQYVSNSPTWKGHLPENISILNEALTSVTGTAANDVWVAGDHRPSQPALLIHYDGSSWKETFLPTNIIMSIWALASNNVWAVSEAGASFNYDGQTWTAKPTGTSKGLRGVWGAKPDEVWAVGAELQVLKWDGSMWKSVDLGLPPPADPTKWEFNNVWGVDGPAVWAIGGNDNTVPKQTILAEYKNGIWTDRASELYRDGVQSTANGHPGIIWASGVDNIWVSSLRGGQNGAYFDSINGKWVTATWCTRDYGGTIWGSTSDDVWCMSREQNGGRGNQVKGSPFLTGGPTGKNNYITDVWSSSKDELWAVGDAGTIMHRKLR